MSVQTISLALATRLQRQCGVAWDVNSSTALNCSKRRQISLLRPAHPMFCQYFFDGLFLILFAHLDTKNEMPPSFPLQLLIVPISSHLESISLVPPCSNLCHRKGAHSSPRVWRSRSLEIGSARAVAPAGCRSFWLPRTAAGVSRWCVNSRMLEFSWPAWHHCGVQNVLLVDFLYNATIPPLPPRQKKIRFAWLLGLSRCFHSLS